MTEKSYYLQYNLVWDVSSAVDFLNTFAICKEVTENAVIVFVRILAILCLCLIFVNEKKIKVKQ